MPFILSWFTTKCHLHSGIVACLLFDVPSLSVDFTGEERTMLLKMSDGEGNSYLLLRTDEASESLQGEAFKSATCFLPLMKSVDM